MLCVQLVVYCVCCSAGDNDVAAYSYGRNIKRDALPWTPTISKLKHALNRAVTKLVDSGKMPLTAMKHVVGRLNCVLAN